MTLGIVAEFNPFHNGHKYLIEEAKKKSGCDTAVAIMSGEWVQRGGIAITDKWTRTEIALKNGIDLVLELPIIYSMNTAQKFASGAAAILQSTGIIDMLAFGSECGDIKALSEAADLLINEPPKVSEDIKRFMSNGITYAAARSAAYEKILKNNVLNNPNDILGVEYIKAFKELNSTMNFCAISRFGANHDACETSEIIASASQIRKMLYSQEKPSDFMPQAGFDIYNSSVLDLAVIAKLRMYSAENLAKINDVSEGLENRFIKAAKKSIFSVEELCMEVKSKRYALSRIRRIAYCAFLDITKDIANLPPSYIRILGMNRNGKALLKKMKKTASLPVIIKPASYTGDDTIFNINNIAEDIFALSAPTKTLQCSGRDLTHSPVIIH